VEAPGGSPSCTDGIDNDDDGLADRTNDPGCHEVEGPPGSVLCTDTYDNDIDGVSDSADSGCSAIEGPPSSPACSDAVDNDGDRFGDNGDPDCAAVAEGPPGSTACADGLDNDFDGAEDSVDSGCSTVEGLAVIESCNDAVDNDGDGVADLNPISHGDPDCIAAEGPPGSSACSDQQDDDGDGLTDKADSGCRKVEGPPSSDSCADGVDNDRDGFGDTLGDPDCRYTIDIVPGKGNEFSCKGNSDLEIAVISTRTFKARTIDVETMTLNGIAHARDKEKLKDVNHDGLRDVVIRFRAKDVQAAIGCPLPKHTEVPVTLDGLLEDGTQFFSSGVLKIKK
jgi:hypothetical protein